MKILVNDRLMSDEVTLELYGDEVTLRDLSLEDVEYINHFTLPEFHIVKVNSETRETFRVIRIGEYTFKLQEGVFRSIEGLV